MFFALKSTFVTLAIIGLLVADFETCCNAFVVGKAVNPKSNQVQKRQASKNNVCETAACKQAGKTVNPQSNQVQKRQASKNNVCETAACKQAATSLLDFMNTTAEPCEDFYQFACGKFLKNTVIPADENNVDVYSITENKLRKQLKETIENKITADDPQTFKKLRSYYLTCLNTIQIEENSAKDFREILKNLGGWPVLDGDKWNESRFDWKATIYALRNVGYKFDYLVDFGIGPDEKNNNQNAITLDQPELGLTQEYLVEGTNNTIVQAYSKYMIDIAIIFGANRTQAEKELAESLNFEIELAKIVQPNEERRNESLLYNPTTISQFQTQVPGIPWLDFINNLLAPYAIVSDNERIIVRGLQFLKSFPILIAKTSKRVVANYLMWRVAFDSADQLDSNVRKAQSEFSSATSGTSDQHERWKECIGKVNDNLNVALGALYVRKNFDVSVKAKVTNMVEYFRRSFQRMLKKVTWMDEQTRAAASNKLKKMFPHIAYPDEFFDNHKLDQYHQPLTIDPQSYLKSQLQANLLPLNYFISNFRKTVNNTDWVTHGNSAVINSFYAFTENSIVFPAAIMQGDFYTVNRPNYINFGAVGYLLGHEMTHGLDDLGRQFDENGNLANWWKPTTEAEYLKRTQCIINQYSNYTVKQVNAKVNGVNTLGENIADNGGIKEAYSAYGEWVQNNGAEQSLPGLPFTPKQIFWISAASIWCRVYRDANLRDALVTNKHSPGEFRVIGPFSNRPEFSNDYNCPLGSPMNPVNKCAVW